MSCTPRVQGVREGASSPTLTGKVLGPDGAPVAGALVAATPVQPVFELIRAEALETSDAEGRFQFAVPPGHYAVSATAPGLTAGGDLVKVEEAGSPPTVEVKLGGEGFTLSGTVRTQDGRPAPGVVVRAIPFNNDTVGAFHVRTDAEGRYTLKLRVDKHHLYADAPGHESRPRGVLMKADASLDLELRPVVVPRSTEAQLIQWVRESAVPVKTLELGKGFEDLERLRGVIGDARVVALGENTHGTREYFQFRHRLFEYLATELGFTVFAVEANWPGSLVLNDYVLGGEGDASKLIEEGLTFWTVDTEEMLELVQWMRRYNMDPSHPRKLQLHGYAHGNPAHAVKGVLNYLHEVEPERVAEVQALVAPLARQKLYWKEYAQLPPEEKERLRQGLEELLRGFDARKAAYVARTGETRWKVARHLVRALGQVEEDLRIKSITRPRDGHMAENVLWMLEQAGPEGRMVVVGHNGHITFGDFPAQPMGWHLRQRLGRQYLTMGFFFHQGSFQAIRQQATAPDKRMPLHEFTVGPAPQGLLEHTLAQAGLPACVVDLRQAPPSIAPWFQSRWRVRSIGAAYHEDEPSYWMLTYPSEEYDTLFFVDQTTRARPLQR